MKSGIYLISNTTNGHLYVGSAVNIQKRFAGHRHQLHAGNHHSRYLQNAWNKYGSESFEFRVLFFCSKENLIFFEQRALDVLKPEYNSSPTAGNCLGVKHTEETKQKCVDAALYRMHKDPEQHKELTRLANEKIRELYADEKWKTRRNAAVTEKLRAQFSKMITFNGETKTQRDWAERIGISPTTLTHRIKHWGLEKALTTPATEKHSADSLRLRTVLKGGSLYDYEGERITAGELAKILGTSRSALVAYLKNHSLEEAIEHYKLLGMRPKGENRSARMVEVAGERYSLADWARRLGITKTSLYVRSSKVGAEKAVEYYLNRNRAA